jgi:hypothetical protein
MTLFAGLLHSVRNDGAHVSVIANRSLSVIANPQGEAIQNTDNEEERIHVIATPTCPVPPFFRFPVHTNIKSSNTKGIKQWEIRKHF